MENSEKNMHVDTGFKGLTSNFTLHYRFSPRWLILKHVLAKNEGITLRYTSISSGWE